MQGKRLDRESMIRPGAKSEPGWSTFLGGRGSALHPPLDCYSVWANPACFTDLSGIAQEQWAPKNTFYVPHCSAKDNLGMCHLELEL